MLKRAKRESKVEAAIFKWQRFGARLYEVQCTIFSRPSERSLGEVDAHDLGVQPFDPPFSTADVDRAQSSGQFGDDLVCAVVNDETARTMEPVVQGAGAAKTFIKGRHQPEANTARVRETSTVGRVLGADDE